MSKNLAGPIKVEAIRSVDELVKKAKWLEGKTLKQVSDTIKRSDLKSRVKTKGTVGELIEKGFFGIKKNSKAEPDIPRLYVELKTCPLKYNKKRTLLSIKEPLSLNIINYSKEVKCKNLKESSLYKKNRQILFVFYIHDKKKKRSLYVIKYVFLWKIDRRVLKELGPDYAKIIEKIRSGKAHEIHQGQHRYLTLCPKHGSAHKYTKQPYSKIPAEIRAFRLKNHYMNAIVTRCLGKTLKKEGNTEGWDAD